MKPWEPRAGVEHELDFHLDMRIRELMAQGLSEKDARETALRRFGDYEGPRRECVEIDERRKVRMTRSAYFKEFKQDVAYAIRMLRRAPVFTLVAVSTLALGIGANSAIFSVVNGVVLQSLPYPNAERLYRVRTLYPDGTPYSLSAPDFMSVRQDSRSLEQVEAYGSVVFTMLGQGDPVEVQGAGVSDGLFALLGFQMSAGRTFLREDHQPGHDNVVILDHGFWQRQFGGDPAVVGRTLTLGGRPQTVIGVLAADHFLPLKAELYAPLLYDQNFSAATATSRRSEFLAVMGLARDGATPEAVDQDLRRVGADLQKYWPNTNGNLTFTSTPLRDFVIGDVRTPLLVLLGAVGFVLLVACANVANLLLARASARHEEIAVRAALGAGRGRLIRQLMTEAAVLGVVGGTAGLALAYAATKALVAAQPGDIPRLREVGVDATVVVFTFAVAVGTSLLFGVLPALQATGRTLTQAIREGGRSGGSGRAGHRARAALVVAEMAMAVVLLTGAGLLIRSFVELTRPPAGVLLDNGLTFRISLQGPSYREAPQVRARVASIEERVRTVPGVRAVAITTVLPLSGLGSVVDFAVEGAPPPPPDVNAEIGYGSASPGYFEVIGTSLKRGRGFKDSDTPESPLVAVINEAGIRRWFRGQEAVGKFVTAAGARREIVGVIADLPPRDRREAAEPQLFVPYAQRSARTIRLVVRTAGDPVAMVPSIRTALRTLDPDLAMVSPMPLAQLVDDAVARPRFYTSLLVLFAAVALALAATGIFGVMSYAVAQRMREISIRMALGAPAGSVVRMILGRALALAAGGAVVGLAAAFALGRVIQDQLFGVTLLDPVTIAAVVGVLLLSATMAGLLPARRASNADPAQALRGDS
jgi:putative ABC transport system permease protein